MELSQFDVEYKPRIAIKGQSVVDFVAEFWPWPNRESTEEVKKEAQVWNLYVDGLLNENGSTGGIKLVSPDNFKITSAIKFKFKVSNNEAE